MTSSHALSALVSLRNEFAGKLATLQQEAQKNGLPFARIPAKDDVEEVEALKTKTLKRQGHLVGWKEPKIDWSKYSNLKNFDVIDEGQVQDANLSKLHRIPVFVKYKTYQYKGYENTYRVMEIVEVSLQRAAEAYDVGNTPVEKGNKGKDKKE
ncbi:MAG: hypothetical protein IH948_00745 [Bacteroidetes bacterium]|nr:hypothetical protein [Bacteroidota bacterium]